MFIGSCQDGLATIWRGNLSGWLSLNSLSIAAINKKTLHPYYARGEQPSSPQFYPAIHFSWFSPGRLAFAGTRATFPACKLLSDVTCLVAGYMYVFLEQQSGGAGMKYFVCLRSFMREHKPQGASHSTSPPPAPHVATPPWPSSLLTSRPAFSHRHNKAPPMPLEAFFDTTAVTFSS